MSFYKTVILDGSKAIINNTPHIRMGGKWYPDSVAMAEQILMKELTKEIDKQIIEQLSNNCRQLPVDKYWQPIKINGNASKLLKELCYENNSIYYKRNK